MANRIEDLNGRRQFDYIVIGCGGIGSAALYWLSKRGDVLGLEKFKLGHENGGSQDVSRIIRLSYGEECYTQLVLDTFNAWEELERESGIQVVYKTGGLALAKRRKGEDTINSYVTAMDKYSIPYQHWDSEQLKSHYPQFTVGPEFEAIFVEDAGLVDAGLANSLHIQMAQGRGAQVLDTCPVTKLTRESDGLIQVCTPLAMFKCKKVIVTAGAWINHVINSIGCHLPVYVTQENVTYFGTPHVKEFTKDKFPIFIYHMEDKDLYGLPVHSIGGTKAGIDAGGPVVTGDTRTWAPDPLRLKKVQDVLTEILPKFLGPEMLTKTCLYTMTPDRKFLIDTCAKANFPDVIVCCGAGHGYKWAALFGKILSEMAADGSTQYDISQFSWEREALTDPNFRPCFFTHNKSNL